MQSGWRRGLVWSLLAVVVAAFLAFMVPSSGSDPEAEALWTHDPSAAFSQARRSGRAMVIDFYADWCGPCRQMERTTLRDRGVMAELEKLVALKVNVDQHRAVAERFGVSHLPTTIIADSEGQPVASHVGYLGAPGYLSLLAKAPKPAQAPAEGEPAQSARTYLSSQATQVTGEGGL